MMSSPTSKATGKHRSPPLPPGVRQARRVLRMVRTLVLLLCRTHSKWRERCRIDFVNWFIKECEGPCITKNEGSSEGLVFEDCSEICSMSKEYFLSLEIQVDGGDPGMCEKAGNSLGVGSCAAFGGLLGGLCAVFAVGGAGYYVKRKGQFQREVMEKDDALRYEQDNMEIEMNINPIILQQSNSALIQEKERARIGSPQRRRLCSFVTPLPPLPLTNSHTPISKHRFLEGCSGLNDGNCMPCTKSTNCKVNEYLIGRCDGLGTSKSTLSLFLRFQGSVDHTPDGFPFAACNAHR